MTGAGGNLLLGAASWTMIPIVLGLLARLVATAILDRTLREALRSHPPSVPLLVETIERRQPWADNLPGVVLIAMAAGIALLALGDGAAAERLERLGIAILLAGTGSSILYYAQDRRARRHRLVQDWLTENPGAAGDWRAMDDGISKADAALAVATAAIALAFAALALLFYWQHYPAITIAGLLAAAAIAAVTVYMQRRARL